VHAKLALQGKGIGLSNTGSMNVCLLYSIVLVPNGNETGHGVETRDLGIDSPRPRFEIR
jgi:hypothetical protein